MTRPCPTCHGDGVIRSEETISIEFSVACARSLPQRHLRSRRFLVQMNPRVSGPVHRHGARVLHALEESTAKRFHFEGLPRARARPLRRTPSRARARRFSSVRCPSASATRVLVEIVEPHMYDADDGVAKIDGYIISVRGASRQSARS